MKANYQSDWRRGERGYFTLIGLLIVIVIIGILFATYFGGTGGGGSATSSGGASTVPGVAAQQARGTVCRNNLSQIRAAIQTQAAVGGGYPSSLESLGLSISLTCPVGGEPYEYDPSTGQVGCVHPGHERF